MSLAAAGSVLPGIPIAALACRRGAGGVVPGRVRGRLGPGAGRRRRRAGCQPGPQLRQGEVGGQLAAAVPHRLAVPVVIAVQPDRVPGDLPGIAAAAPQLDPQPGHLLEQREELLLAAGGRRGGGGVPPQGDPRRLGPPVAGRLSPPRPGPAGRAAVRSHGGQRRQAVLGSMAAAPRHLVVVVAARGRRPSWRASSATMCTWSRRAGSRPTAPPRLLTARDRPVRCMISAAIAPTRRRTGPGRRARRGPSSATPACPGPRSPSASCGWVSSAVRCGNPAGRPAGRRLQPGRVPPAGHQVRADMLAGLPFPVQVVQQPGRVAAPRPGPGRSP